MFYLITDLDTEFPFFQLCDTIPYMLHKDEYSIEPVSMPTIEQLESANMSIGEVANNIYKGMTFDTAKPQQWMDFHSHGDSERYDLLRLTVWLYTDKFPYGVAAPLCQESKDLLDTINRENEAISKSLQGE